MDPEESPGHFVINIISPERNSISNESTNIRQLGNVEHFKDVVNNAPSGRPVVVKFEAEWCRPCRLVAPRYREMSSRFDDVIFCAVDLDDATEVAQLCDVNTVPSFLVYRDGEKTAEVIGAALSELELLLLKNTPDSDNLERVDLVSGHVVNGDGVNDAVRDLVVVGSGQKELEMTDQAPDSVADGRAATDAVTVGGKAITDQAAKEGLAMEDLTLEGDAREQKGRAMEPNVVNDGKAAVTLISSVKTEEASPLKPESGAESSNFNVTSKNKSVSASKSPRVAVPSASHRVDHHRGEYRKQLIAVQRDIRFDPLKKTLVYSEDFKTDLKKVGKLVMETSRILKQINH